MGDNLSTVTGELSVLINDVAWIKNQATMGGRFTAQDGKRHETLIKESRKLSESNKERIIILESKVK